MIKDTEEMSLEDELGEGEGESSEEGEGEKGGGGLAIEPGSAAALLEGFIGRYIHRVT